MSWFPIYKSLKEESGGGGSSSEITIKSFTTGTDAEIAAMLTAYYNNELTWEQMGWNIGDPRKIHINAMAAATPNSSTTLPEQDITVVIVAHDQTDLAESINGHTKACITVQTKECLHNTTGFNGTGDVFINGSNDYDTIFTKWSNSYIKTYLNNIVWGAFPSNDFKTSIKQSKHYRHTAYNTSASEQVTDTLFLPSYPEVFGTLSYENYTPTSPNTEGSLFEYYQTASNRIKYGNNNGEPINKVAYWWLGSPSTFYNSTSGYYWCSVHSTNSSAWEDAGSNSLALAPVWAM